MSNICGFDRILKTECNLQHFTRNFRIKNLDDFERDEADAYLWREGLLNMKKKGMAICYIMNRCLGMFLKGGKGKCCEVLMKHCRKVKDEQVITLHMSQQLKTKNINVVPGQLFFPQCKVKFLLETDLLYW